MWGMCQRGSPKMNGCQLGFLLKQDPNGALKDMAVSPQHGPWFRMGYVLKLKRAPDPSLQLPAWRFGAR